MKTTPEESKELDRLIELSESKNPYVKECPNRHLWSEGFRSGFNYVSQPSDVSDSAIEKYAFENTPCGPDADQVIFYKIEGAKAMRDGKIKPLISR